MAILETAVAESFGGISRQKNTRRVFVGPGMIDELATTATWVLQQTANVPELFTTDGGSTNILGIPFPGEYVQFGAENGGAAVDRGIRILGIELMYQVATSALGAFSIDIFKITLTEADGQETAATVASTDTFLGGATGKEVDDNRVQTLIAKTDRFFLDDVTSVYAEVNMTDGTASDITIRGAIWHFERIEE